MGISYFFGWSLAGHEGLAPFRLDATLDSGDAFVRTLRIGESTTVGFAWNGPIVPFGDFIIELD
ncbi:MAG TPA: hypothetical protein VGI99_08720, partial [Gemmataceae bacterium]